MSRNGSGTYSLPAGNPVTTNTTITSTWGNTTLSDIATALTQSLAYDGQTVPIANIPMGGFAITGLASGIAARTRAANIGDVQDGLSNWVAAAGTADAITAAYSPAITALVDGQLCFFRASAANATTTPTFSPNGLTARTITKQGGVALVVGDIPGLDAEVIIRYKLASTRWELLNPQGTVGVLTGTFTDWGSTTIPSGYLERDGSNVSRATYAALYTVLNKTATVTITIATPGVVTWTAHGLSNNDVVKFSTTGALPTGLVAGTTYYVRNKAANTFEVSATEGGASINTTGTQSGVQTGIHTPWGDGDGSTTFTLPDSRRRVDVGRGGSLTTTLGARLGATGGEETHTMTTAELKDHTHSQSGTTMLGNTTAPNTGGTFAGSTSQGGTTSSTGSATPFNVMQPSEVIVKLIKT